MNKKMWKPTYIRNTVLNVAIVIFVAALLLFLIDLVRTQLLQNAQRLGTALVQSYAAEEEMTIEYLEKETSISREYINEIIEDGGTREDVRTWLQDYSQKIVSVIGKNVMDFYVVMDGQTIAADPNAGELGLSANSDWSQMSTDANGSTLYGKIYTDSSTGEKVFIIAQELLHEGHEGDALVTKVFIQNSFFHNTVHTLPENCSYYLCDSNGTLLYAITQWNANANQLQEYVDYLIAGFENGTLSHYDDIYEDMQGVTRGAYCQKMSNGWSVIMTVPVNSILMGGKDKVVYMMVGISLLLLFVLASMMVQDAIRSRRMKKADDTAHMLGDSFYAIYRVNFKNETYETFKTYDNLQSDLSPNGDYSVLLQAIGKVVRPSTFLELKENFSLKSICDRVEHGISDYGGDYQRRFGDRYRWVNIRTLYDPKRAPDEVILCFRDVDEEKRRELQHTIILQEALETAQKSTKAQSEFFSRMSHDMRTPLNAIIGCCGLAENSCAEGKIEKAKEYVKKIKFAGNQLLVLINDILELSRMEAGKHSLNQKEFDLRQLLLNIADIFRDNAQAENKTLDVNIDFKNAVVLGDEKQIGQIVNNLLSNAVKYTNPGDRILLEVRQFDFQKNSKYQIIVEDTGIGMSAGFLKHLFDPYSRETSFSANPAMGTGLGMAIVKSLVQQMNGEISVDSVLGKGSRFTVTIPLRTVEQSQVSLEAQNTTNASDFAWSSKNILVAEDNELNREISKEILKQMGARVLTAVNGVEAVNMFQSSDPYSIDAILMDMQMPEMDGCEAAETIRGLKRADAADVPIVAVTANVFAEDIDRTTKAGMNDHIPKPIDRELLRRTLQRVIQERRSDSEKRTVQGREE